MVFESGQSLVDAGILVIIIVTSGQDSGRFQARTLKSAIVASLLVSDEHRMGRQAIRLGSELYQVTWRAGQTPFAVTTRAGPMETKNERFRCANGPARTR